MLIACTAPDFFECLDFDEHDGGKHAGVKSSRSHKETQRSREKLKMSQSNAVHYDRVHQSPCDHIGFKDRGCSSRRGSVKVRDNRGESQVRESRVSLLGRPNSNLHSMINKTPSASARPGGNVIRGRTGDVG